MQQTTHRSRRLMVLGLVTLALVASFALVRGQANAMPILGQYPTGNFQIEFEGLADEGRIPAQQIAIDHVGAGLFDISGDGLQGVVRDADDPGTDVFQLRQQPALTISEHRPGAIRVDGSWDVRLTSAETGALFTWEPRIDADVRCLEGGPSLDRCEAIEVKQVLAGNISAPDGRGTCGSMEQHISFVIILDQDGMTEPTAGFWEWMIDEHVHAIASLDVTNAHCAAAIYGAVPGSEPRLRPGKNTAWVSVSGTSTTEGRETAYELQFEGQLRDGTSIRGDGAATLTVRRDAASGDIEGEIIIGGAEPVEFEGTLRLENLRMRGDLLTGHGSLEFLASETEGMSEG